ncbi:MAG: hypothetical protein O2956_14105 [Gemmatimonadetes bacterium]|nr:hypothetical protein [Gemmatimonadota bacterium]
MTRGAPFRRPGLLLGVLTFVLLCGRASAQTPDELAAICSGIGGLPGACAATSVASQAVLGGVGLLAGFGSEVSGTASNLGTRVGGGPRLSFSIRAGAVHMGMPDIEADPSGLTTRTFMAPAVHMGVGVGLFDGFRLMPTVGGFLSTDAFVQTSFLSLPQGEGFVGGTRSYSVGVRVGVFREGFTIPGVSVSVARRFSGEVEYGSDGASMVLDPVVTSLRATIGKDLYAVEFLAGVGWDEYTGDTDLRVPTALGAYVTPSGTMSGSRRLYFGSAAMTLSIVLTVSVEGGWGQGFDPSSAYSGAFDPTKGAPFGSFSLRLTL